MAMIEREEWSKLHIAKFDDWTLGVCGSQHVLGWLIIFPPRKIQDSLAHLTDDELLKFKQIALIAEDLLKEVFDAQWFNYSQAGNVVKNLHIHLQPRYPNNKTFEGHVFTDEGWGHTLKHLPFEQLPPKEVVLKIVKVLREALSKKKIDKFKIQILDS